MKLKELGKNTSAVEVTHIDSMGFWVLLNGKEYYLSFSDFPWFLNASIRSISYIKKESDTHLYWPDLDVDLTIDMIENPEVYSLQYK